MQKYGIIVLMTSFIWYTGNNHSAYGCECFPPEPNVLVGNDVVCIGNLLMFYGGDSIDPDGTTLSYSWNLGSGAYDISGENSVVAYCRYDSSGSKTVILEVTDDDHTACCGEESTCKDKKDTAEVEVTVVDLVSLELEIDDPNECVEIDDEDEDEDTKSYIVKKELEGVLIVKATSDPNINAEDLPNCWSLACTQGIATIEDKKTAKIDKSTTGKTVIQCTCGSTTKTVTIYVVNLEITNPQYLAENDPFDSSGRYCYNSAHPGICNVSASGTTGISELNVDLEWTITAISGSTLTSDPNTGKGASITFTYTELPSGNSGFGIKTLTLTHPKIPSAFNTDTQEVEIYYTFDAKNWPGADPNGGVFPPNYNLPYAKPPYRYEKQNWYVYYSQTDAHNGCVYISEYSGSSRCSPYDHPDYTPYVGLLSNPHQVLTYNHPCGSETKNNGENLYGIDVFAWASRHEMKHHEDYTAWWGPSGVNDPNDLDGDRVPDDLEPNFPCSDGGPYEPNMQNTYEDSDFWSGYDDQTECCFTQDTWETTEIIIPSGPNQGKAFRKGDEYDNDWGPPRFQMALISDIIKPKDCC